MIKLQQKRNQISVDCTDNFYELSAGIWASLQNLLAAEHFIQYYAVGAGIDS